MLTYRAMLGQILLTAAVIVVAYLVLRSRWRPPERRVAVELHRRRPPAGLARTIATSLVGIMVLGSAYFLIDQWARAREVMTVQVINANTGRITLYEARRGKVKGRGFVTLDGQQVTLADVERMILRDHADSIPAQSPGGD